MDDESLQSAAAHGSHNIIVQAVGNGVNISVGRPHLTLIPPRNRARDIRTEIDLLNAYCRSIDLVGREADMQSLWEWLHSPKPIAVRTLKGRAGAGKTRLAIELIERLNTERKDQWYAGFVRRKEMVRFAEQQNLSDWGWAKPTLVVVDYAASLLEPLREWLRDLAQNPARNGGKTLRLLLLERQAEANEGWLQFLCSGGFSDAAVPDLFDPLEPKRLDTLDTLEQRRVVLGQMLEKAARLVNCPPPKIPTPGQSPIVDTQLGNEEWADPLYLMMAALLSLRSDLVAVLQLPRTQLAMRLVDHEITRLAEGAPRGFEQLSVHLAAFAALGNGLSHELALRVAEQECTELRLDYPGGAGALVKQVHDVLHAPDKGIASIIPDILAEALVLKAIKVCSAVQQDAAILRAVKGLGNRVIPFLVRCAQDFAPAGEIAPLNWLEHLIKSGKTDDLGLLIEIENAIPHQTLVLREKAVEVGELLAERLGKLAQESPNEEILAELGRFLNNLSVRLSDLGRREEALAKAQEAVRIREQLAQARPDAFLPDLAGSLNNLANMLSALGRREEALAKAQEAVRIYGQLAQARPDAFLPDLARSLAVQGNCLLVIGKNQEALALFVRAIQVLTPLFVMMPTPFMQLMAALIGDYFRIAESCEAEPDTALLRPVLEVFEKLKQNQPKE